MCNGDFSKCHTCPQKDECEIKILKIPMECVGICPNLFEGQLVWDKSEELYHPCFMCIYHPNFKTDEEFGEITKQTLYNNLKI